jgi:hypothetical protein
MVFPGDDEHQDPEYYFDSQSYPWLSAAEAVLALHLGQHDPPNNCKCLEAAEEAAAWRKSYFLAAVVVETNYCPRFALLRKFH